MSWTQDRVGTALRLWAKGWTVNQIAANIEAKCGFVGITRNAVIGKLHRLKAHNRKAARALCETMGEWNDNPDEPIFILPPTNDPRPRAHRKHPFTPTTFPKTTEKERAGVSTAVDAPFPAAMVPCSLIELDSSRCKWPIGHPNSPDFFFCGGTPVEGLPYCSVHTSLSYQPGSALRKEQRDGRRQASR